MTRTRWTVLFIGIVVILLVIWFIQEGIRTGSRSTEYFETFDEVGSWTTGEDVNASGIIRDGQYEIIVNLIGDIYWVTAGEDFGDGYYQVQASPKDGALDNGYGMLIRVDEDDGRFYIFKVSSDGYVFIGLCSDSCLETEVLVSQDWFSSPAVSQGFGITNTLGISAVGPDMTFFVNDTEVGHITDTTLRAGDIGLLAETFAPGGLKVAFDNFKVTPVDED